MEKFAIVYNHLAEDGKTAASSVVGPFDARHLASNWAHNWLPKDAQYNIFPLEAPHAFLNKHYS